MIRAQIIDTWQVGVIDRVQKIANLFNVNLTDVIGTDGTHIVPDPNIVVVQIVCSESVFNSILSDNQYGDGAILFDNPNPYPADGFPDAAEYGKRRSYCAKLGMSQQQFVQLFGTQGNPKNRGQAATDCAEWARNLPKGNN